MRKMDAEHVEAMWSLPTCGVLRAGPIADGIIVRVRRPGRGGLTRLAVAPPADRRGPRHAFAPRGWRGPPSPRLTGRSIPAKGEVEPRVKSARPGSQGTCRGRYHTGGPAVAEPVYVLPVAVAGSVGATVRAGRSGAGGCVVGRGVAPLTKGTRPAPRSAFHGALTPLHGAARAAHPAPQPMGRALHSHGVAPGSGAAVVGQLCALANPARDWRADPGPGTGGPGPGSRGALTLRRFALAVSAIYLGFTGAQIAGPSG